MTRSKSSGYKLSKADARIVLGMQARGDRDHDIAAWFGVNQGRIAEAPETFGSEAAAADELPPKGPPGVKGRRLRDSVYAAINYLQKGDPTGAQACLEKAAKIYDTDEP